MEPWHLSPFKKSPVEDEVHDQSLLTTRKLARWVKKLVLEKAGAWVGMSLLCRHPSFPFYGERPPSLAATMLHQITYRPRSMRLAAELGLSTPARKSLGQAVLECKPFSFPRQLALLGTNGFVLPHKDHLCKITALRVCIISVPMVPLL